MAILNGWSAMEHLSSHPTSLTRSPYGLVG